jgi:hypothetical protein
MVGAARAAPAKRSMRLVPFISIENYKMSINRVLSNLNDVEDSAEEARYRKITGRYRVSCCALYKALAIKMQFAVDSRFWGDKSIILA